MFEFKIWKEPMLVLNKRYINEKPLISAFIWHPESGRGIIRRVPRLLAVKSKGGRGGFLTLCLL